MIVALLSLGLLITILIIIISGAVIIYRKYFNKTGSETNDKTGNNTGNNTSNTNNSSSEDNVIPFQIKDENLDNYSVKIIDKNNNATSIYSGKFQVDFVERNICLQRIFMELIESIIQRNIISNFTIGLLPTLGKPYDANLKAKDILVSFPDKGNYLIFSEDLKIYFYSVDKPVEIYDNNIDGPTFNFVSSYYQTSYSGTYNTYGIFTINITNNYNTNNTIILNNEDLTYDSINITKQTLTDGTLLYKGDSVFLTIIPDPLPNNITVAGYVLGIFSTNAIRSTYNIFYNYILNRYNFTNAQKSKVEILLSQLYYPMEYSLRYGIGFKDRYTYSSNNGFTNISNTKDFILDIRIS